MKKEALIFLLVFSLLANLAMGISLKLVLHPPETEPPKAETKPAETEPTKEFDLVDVFFPLLPHQTEPNQEDVPPPETQPPQTQAPENEPKKQYSRQELEALDNTLITYGPGTASDGNPAPYAPGAQEKYGKYAAHFIEDTENVIYLTFDCGYEYFVDDKPVTGMILDTLKEKNIKALFFVTQSYVEKNPELVRRIIEEGHALGSHSSDHHSMPSLSIDDMEKQILSLHDYVKKHFGYTMKFFRPPSGEFSERSLAVTQNLGYETVHWSFAYADWDPANQPEPAAALKKILSCHHDGAIYLLHAVSVTNATVLEDVIEGLWELGYHLELLK